MIKNRRREYLPKLNDTARPPDKDAPLSLSERLPRALDLAEKGQDTEAEEEYVQAASHDDPDALRPYAKFLSDRNRWE